MATLHLVVSAAGHRSAQQVAATDDTLVLLQEGVYVRDERAFVIADDAEARGCTAQHTAEQLIDFARLVEADGVAQPNRYLVVIPPSLDRDGYLKALDDWTPAVAEWLAEQSGIELSASHWQIIEAAREFYARTGCLPRNAPFGKARQSNRWRRGWLQHLLDEALSRQPRKVGEQDRRIAAAGKLPLIRASGSVGRQRHYLAHDDGRGSSHALGSN